jgi:hypothetical protein
MRSRKKPRGMTSTPANVMKKFIYWLLDWTRYWDTSDIGMTLFSPTYFLLMSEKQMSMPDITDIKSDVGAHLCS